MYNNIVEFSMAEYKYKIKKIYVPVLVNMVQLPNWLFINTGIKGFFCSLIMISF